ncbi:MAG TPA: tetratricopeptide repeat protein, partial [Ramlibacter sp.]|nr:tetratricopeptide repeat protein [Ramlibacter sp.]
LSDLAMALNALRRRDEAEPVFRRALAMMRAAHNGDHRDIALALNNQAWGLHAMGRGDEAAPLYEEALAMQQRLGVAAVERAQTQNNLAGLYYDRGDLDRAGTIWADVLVTYEGVFGSGGHAAVARAQNMVALVAIERGRFDEAARLTLAALQTNLRLLGERHRWTAITLQSHGAALLGLGRLAEAEALMRRSLAVRRAVLPAGHAEMVGPQLGLGRVALARGDAAAAERALRSALALIEAVRTPDRVPRDRVELALARAVALQGRRNEGQRIAAGAIERMRAALPATHWRLQAAQAALGLPPFVALAGPAQSAAARATLVALRERLGPGADVVRELAAALGE